MDRDHLEEKQNFKLREPINLPDTGSEEVSSLPAPSLDCPPQEVDRPGLRSKWENRISEAGSKPEPGSTVGKHGQAQRKSARQKTERPIQNRHRSRWHISLLIVLAVLLSIFAAAKDYPLESLKVLGDWSIDNGNTRLAAQLYHLAFRGDPRYQTFLITWSKQRRQEKNYDDSAYLLTEAIKATPNRSSLYLQRGNDHTLCARTPEALADYNRAIELDPTNAAAANNRGCLFLHNRQLEEAFQSLRKATELQPKSSLYWLNLGDCYFLKEDYDQAISAYERAVILEDRRGWAKSQMAEARGGSHEGSFWLKISNDMRRQQWAQPQADSNDLGLLDTKAGN